MRKILYTFSTAALMLGGLTACNTDQGASTNSNDNARPIGYYSNENDRDRTDRNGNGYSLRDNDGPLTEIMDRNGTNNNNGNDRTGIMNNNSRTGVMNNDSNRNNRTGVMNNDRNNRNNRTGVMNNDRDNRNNQTGVMNNRTNNPNRTGIMNYRDEQRRNGIMNHRNDQRRSGIMNDGQGSDINPYSDGIPNTMRDNGHGHADENYHSHLNDNNHRVQTYGYYNNNDGKLVRKISDRVAKIQNVDDARVIVSDDNILVAIDTNDSNNGNVKDAVKRAVKPMANGKNVNVITDEGTFTRVRDIDNDIRNGNRRETIDTDIKDLFDNIGNTFKAPFTNHNRG